MARPPRIPVWLGLDQPVIYFVTLCVENRLRVLDNAEVFTAIEAFAVNQPCGTPSLLSSCPTMCTRSPPRVIETPPLRSIPLD